MSAVKDAVEASGFVLLWLELEIRGTLSDDQANDESPRVSLTITETGQRILLYQGESDEEREIYNRLIKWIDKPQRVAVRVRVRDLDTDVLALTVHTFHMP